MIWTVSFAASSFTSAHSTLAPSRAKSTAAAFPFPQPGPTDPAPTTSATFSCKRPTMALSNFYKSALVLCLNPIDPHTPLVAVGGQSALLTCDPCYHRAQSERAVDGPHADRKFVNVDLAFYLPGQFYRTQPRAVWPRGTERR